MNDLQLLDGRVLDAIRDGDWLFVGPTGFILLLGLVLGFVSWLKGRKFLAIFVWLLMLAGSALLALPLDTVQRIVDADSSSLHWALFGLVAGAVGIGFITAIRLARPPSWWAQRRYDNDRYAEAIERHHWTRPQAR